MDKKTKNKIIQEWFCSLKKVRADLHTLGKMSFSDVTTVFLTGYDLRLVEVQVMQSDALTPLKQSEFLEGLDRICKTDHTCKHNVNS